MYNDVRLKQSKGNQILFNRESVCLQELIKLIAQQKHYVILKWIFDCMLETQEELLTKYPQHEEIMLVYQESMRWAYGEIKMPIAKQHILGCHRLAKYYDDKSDIALFHALAQGCSAVHVDTHALGFIIYKLTSSVLSNENWEPVIDQEIQNYYQKLKYYSKLEAEIAKEPWALFIKKEKSNKENELLMKKKLKKPR